MATVAIAHHDLDIMRRDVSASDIAVSIAFTEKWADLFILHGSPFALFAGHLQPTLVYVMSNRHTNVLGFLIIQ
jgi:hypothetical protein